MTDRPAGLRGGAAGPPRQAAGPFGTFRIFRDPQRSAGGWSFDRREAALLGLSILGVACRIPGGGAGHRRG